MKAPQPLVKRIAGQLEAQQVGFSFALLGALVAVLAFGLAPTALALGLLALLVVE